MAGSLFSPCLNDPRERSFQSPCLNDPRERSFQSALNTFDKVSAIDKKCTESVASITRQGFYLNKTKI